MPSLFPIQVAFQNTQRCVYTKDEYLPFSPPRQRRESRTDMGLLVGFALPLNKAGDLRGLL
jgi:hypothetical protein